MSEIYNEFVAGAFGGLVGLVAGHPCDTMKTVTQNSKAGATPGMRQLGQTMIQLGGKTFFRGLSVPVWSYAVVNSVFFGTHKSVCKALGVVPDAVGPEDENWYRLAGQQYGLLVVSGAIAGTVQLIPSVPVEVIKVRMQKDAHIEGARPLVRTTVREIFRENGVRGFYRGGAAQFMRDVPASASYFCTYEATRRLLRRNTNFSDLTNCLIAGAFGGWISWILPLPQDVIKTRLQSGRDKDIRSCLRSMWAEGYRSFFKGLGLVSIRAFLVNGVTFWGYEVAMQYFRSRPEDSSPSPSEVLVHTTNQIQVTSPESKQSVIAAATESD